MNEDKSIELQKKVYATWANNILNKRNLVVNELIEDFIDGVLLINLMEVLTNEPIQHISRPKNRFQQLSNVQLALNVIDKWGINLVNFRPENLVDRHPKMTLALVWRIISKFHIQPYLCDDDSSVSINDLPTSSDTNSDTSSTTSTTTTTTNYSNNSTGNLNSSMTRRGGSNIADSYKSSATGSGTSGGSGGNSNRNTSSFITPREALLRWCRRELESYPLAQPVTNFCKSFQNSQVFAYLVHKQAPQALDLDDTLKLDELSALKRCFEVAEKQLGIPQLLNPQNIVDGIIDESCTMTYVACFLNSQKIPLHNGQLPQQIQQQAFTRSHNRTSSTGSTSSTSSIDSIGIVKQQQQQQQQHPNQPPLPPIAPSLNVSSDRSFTKRNNNNKQTPTGSPSSYHNSTLSPKSSTSAEQQHQLMLWNSQSLIEILNNFTNELKRITNEHEEMLNKTAAKLDERVNRLGDKLDQLEIKIGVIKNVVVGGVNGVDSAGENSLSATPDTVSSIGGRSSSTPVKVRKETKEERDERREKRRSRRREREERKIKQHQDGATHSQGGVNGISGAVSTMTQSSSSCSLADDAQLVEQNREEVKKVVKVQALVRGFLQRRAYKKIKNRRDVAMEILNTEKTYIAGLQCLLQDYLNPLRKMSDSVINPDSLKTLYNNIEVINNINGTLLKRLQERMATPWHYQQLFGDIFFKMSDLLKCYIAYVNHYNRSLQIINDLMKSNSLVEFLTSTAMRTNQQLRDLVIIPIQRIPRYVLLLEEMVKVTDAAHPDRLQLTQSLTKMQSIADHVNEKRRDFENVTHVSLLQDAIIGFNIMDYPSLRYMMEGDLQFHMASSGGSGFGTAITGTISSAVTGVPGSDFTGSHKSNNTMVLTNLHIFLFNQMMVICKYKKSKESYFSKLAGGTLSKGDRHSKQPKYKFIFQTPITNETRLSHNKSEFWFGVDNGTEYRRFIAKTVAEKDMWIQHLQGCITKATENKKSKDSKA